VSPVEVTEGIPVWSNAPGTTRQIPKLAGRPRTATRAASSTGITHVETNQDHKAIDAT